MTSSGRRTDLEKYSAWANLHHAMADSPLHHPVNAWRYRHPLASTDDASMDLWPLIKCLYMVGACHRVHAGAPDLPPPTPATPPQSSSARLPNTRMRWPNLDCEVLMLGSSVGNQVLDHLRSQHHLDPLREALSRMGLRSTTLLTDVSAEQAQNTPTLLGRTFGAARIMRAIQSHLPPSGSFNLDSLIGFERWHADISALYPIEHVLTRPHMQEIIEKVYSAAYCLRRYFAQQALKAVVTYCYYGVLGFGAALACRSLGIPFFDMQHGSAGEHHHCYDWPGMPAGGYNTLPTHFLCWSEVECKAIARHATRLGPTALHVGHSWRLMEQLLLSVGEGAGAARFVPPTAKAHYASFSALAARHRAARAACGVITVLVTLRADEDISWLAPLLTATDSRLHFLLRLHPAESRDAARLAQRVATLERPHVEVTRASATPMPALLRECEVHLTAYSSSVLDALAFGVPSLCYAWSSRWFYSPEQYPLVRMVAATPEAVSAALLAQRTLPVPPPCASLSEIGAELASAIVVARTKYGRNLQPS